MDALFFIRRLCLKDEVIPGYWIGSTAPCNVDDNASEEVTAGQDASVTWEELLPAKGINEIAGQLAKSPDSEIVISIHGFNNPRSVVEERYSNAFQFVNSDTAIRDKKGLVFVGYEWPSEKMGAPLTSSIAAMPGAMYSLLALSLVFLVISHLIQSELPASQLIRNIGRAPVYALGLVLFSIPFATWALRTVVYFRDSYRAMHYAVPDLVEFIRQLDQAIHSRSGASEEDAEPNNIRLSFIGHSMGAFVTTNTVRILSDVFDPKSIGTPSTDDPGKLPGPEIGRNFKLGRLVLVSPDIPAEAIMMRRANFLVSSLRRFEESYLFSNEGDVVLRMISTIANYFSFPMKQRGFGHRLGNVEVLSDGFGVVNLQDAGTGIGSAPDVTNEEYVSAFLSKLRVGNFTFKELHKGLPQPSTKDAPKLPLLFSYFDCTDYTENGKGLLTFARKKAKLTWWDKTRLLSGYLRQKVDVHSGYFSGQFSQSLIYRVSCLGFDGLLDSLGGSADTQELSNQCEQHSIQALLSPERCQAAQNKALGLQSVEGDVGGTSDKIIALRQGF